MLLPPYEEDVSERSSSCRSRSCVMLTAAVLDVFVDLAEADEDDVVFQFSKLPIDQYEWSTSLACSIAMSEYTL